MDLSLSFQSETMRKCLNDNWLFIFLNSHSPFLPSLAYYSLYCNTTRIVALTFFSLLLFIFYERHLSLFHYCSVVPCFTFAFASPLSSSHLSHFAVPFFFSFSCGRFYFYYYYYLCFPCFCSLCCCCPACHVLFCHFFFWYFV